MTLSIPLRRLSFLLLALAVPGLGGLAGDLPLMLEQLGFAAQRGQFGLLIGLDLADLGDFFAAIIQLRGQPGLGQLRVAQTFLQQAELQLLAGQAALQRPGHIKKRNSRRGKTEQRRCQRGGQIDWHKQLRRKVLAV